MTESARTLVILDEVHHGGDALSWGDAHPRGLRARHPAPVPDRDPVPLRHRADPVRGVRPRRPGHPRSRAPTTLRLRPRPRGRRRPAGALHGLRRADALAPERRRRDGGPARRGQHEGHHLAGLAHRARPGGRLDPRGAARGRPAADRGASGRARRRRPRDRDRPDRRARLRQDPARASAASRPRSSSPTRRRPASGSPTFSQDTKRWMVAVRMVSEGVDVPRLAVGVYATSSSTPAVLRAGHRPLRAGPAPRRDRVDLPAERAEPDGARRSTRAAARPRARPTRRPTTGLDDSLLGVGRTARRRRPTCSRRSSRSRPSAPTRIFDRVLYDGGEFGFEAEVGSMEELDFLGIPGLLEPDQVRELLQQRQQRQEKRRKKTGEPKAPRRGRARSCPDVPQPQGAAQPAQQPGRALGEDLRRHRTRWCMPSCAGSAAAPPSRRRA